MDSEEVDTDKPPINDQNSPANEWPLKNIKNPKKFSKEYQPSGSAKAKGWKKWRQLKTFNEDLRSTMCEVATSSGEKVNFFEWMANKLQRNIITNKDKKEMSIKDENAIMMEIIKFFKQDDKKIELETSKPIRIVVERGDENL